jgi:hypothetical protein
LYESAASQIYTQGSLTLDDCDVLDDVGQAGFELPRYSMWVWIVAANGGAVRLLGSRFRTSATHSFDSCMYQENGSCDPALGGCLAGTDYRDCGTEPPQASGPFGKLISLDSQDARLEVRRCTVTNLTLHGTKDLDVPAGKRKVRSLDANRHVSVPIRVDCYIVSANDADSAIAVLPHSDVTRGEDTVGCVADDDPAVVGRDNCNVKTTVYVDEAV